MYCIDYKIITWEQFPMKKSMLLMFSYINIF